MRISDWRSDVCSSDLDAHAAGGTARFPAGCAVRLSRGWILRIRDRAPHRARRQAQGGDQREGRSRGAAPRAVERGGGEAGVSTCRYRWSTEYKKTKRDNRREINEK